MSEVRAQVQCHCAADPTGHLHNPDKGCPKQPMTRMHLIQAAILYRAYMDNINPHVLPADVKAVIADGVLNKVERQVITTYMVETRNMHVTIKWLIDHLEECYSSWLRYPEGDDERAVPITTLDAVRQWLENMSGALGAEGDYDLDNEIALKLLDRGRYEELRGLLIGALSPEEIDVE